jgi:outer membrane biosynthesis protein TonB
MALSDDQRAMLRLLAQREEGYEDIAALMGLSVDEVRAKVKEALGSLEGAKEETGEPAADVAPPPASSPKPPEPAAATPPAETPPFKPLPADPKPQKPAPSRPKPTAGGGAGFPMPKDRSLRLALVAGIGVTLVLILLLVTGVLGGGESDSAESTGADTGNPPAQQDGELANDGKQLTQAVLEAVDGGEGKGAAIFGKAAKDVVIVLHAEGLAPTSARESYVVSLSRSPTERTPIAASKVGQSGEINDQFKVATQTVGLLASGFDDLEISLVSNAEVRKALERSQKTGDVPVYSGTDVLRGQVEGPAVRAIKDQE